jgi:hypothetical protein
MLLRLPAVTGGLINKFTQFAVLHKVLSQRNFEEITPHEKIPGLYRNYNNISLVGM